MSSVVGTHLLAAVIGGLVASVIFASLWLAWLRRVQGQLKRIERLMMNQPIPAVRKPVVNEETFAENIHVSKPELVAQFKVKDGQQTVSVLEADGKRFLRVDGDLSWKQRLKMLRYLKSEGFME